MNKCCSRYVIAALSAVGLSAPALAQAGSDACSTSAPAITLGVPVVSDSATATTDFSITPASTCGGFTGSGGGKDVFYTFTPGATDYYEVSLCGSSFDTVVAVMSACGAAAANVVACNDDASPSCGANNSRINSVQLSSGVTYIIRVAGYGTSSPESGAFTLQVSSAAPPLVGDICASGASLPEVPSTGGTVMGDAFGASADGDASCGDFVPGVDVWYRFTPATAGPWRISLCSTGIPWDTVLSVHTACPTDISFNQVPGGCQDQGCPGTDLSNISSLALTAGVQVLIRIAPYTGDPDFIDITPGPFVLEVTDLASASGACCACDGTCAVTTTGATGCAAGARFVVAGTCEPTNSCPIGTGGLTCECAQTLALDAGQAFDLSLSTVDSIISCSSGTDGLWYSFTAPTDGEYAFVADATSGAGFPSMAFFTDCGTELDCFNDGTDTTLVITGELTAGQNILIRVGAFADTPWAGTVRVTQTALGTCCVDSGAQAGTCFLLFSGACPTGTTLSSGTTCEPTNPCQPVNSCCDSATFACTLIFGGDCPAGTIPNLATACAPTNPCSEFPLEACCNGTACVVVQNSNAGGSPTACAGGSVSQGINTTCVPTNPCFVNDECSGAITLTVGTLVNGTTVDATGALPASCSIGEFDVWYTFTAPSDNTYTFQAIQQSASSSVVSLFTDCTQATELACVSGGTTVSPTAVDVVLAMTAGQAVKVRVSSYADIEGPFTLVVTAPTPVNEFCCRGTTCAEVAAGSCTGMVSGSNATTVPSCGAGNSSATCCFADFNHVGGVTIDDLFLYLNAYFTGSPWANYGGDGVATPVIDDLFLFLNSYFTGCQP